MDFLYWKSQRFGKSPVTFGSRFFEILTIHRLIWISVGFLVVLNLLHHCFV